MWRRSAICSRDSSSSIYSGSGLVRVQEVVSRAAETLRRTCKVSGNAPRPQQHLKETLASAKGEPLFSQRLPVLGEDSQVRAAILVSRTVAEEEEKSRRLLEKQLAEALHVSEGSVAAARDELILLEAQLQDALCVSRLDAEAAVGHEEQSSCVPIGIGESEEELAAALAEVQITLLASARSPQIGEFCQPPESEHAAEATGPACFDMVVAGSSQLTLPATLFPGGQCTLDRVQGPDALDNWWGGSGADGATLDVSGCVPGNESAAKEEVSMRDVALGIFGGA